MLKQSQNADKWHSFGGRSNGKKDYKHLVGSDSMAKKSKTKGNPLLLAIAAMPTGKQSMPKKKMHVMPDGSMMSDDEMMAGKPKAKPKKKKTKKGKKGARAQKQAKTEATEKYPASFGMA